MDLATRVHILDAAIGISHSPNTLGKDLHLTILPPPMDK